MALDLNEFMALLHTAVQRGVSDVHLRTDERPYFREANELKAVKAGPYSLEDMKAVCQILIKDSKIKESLEQITEYDGAFDAKPICRVRYNILRYQDKIGIIIRIITYNVPTIKDLGLKKVIAEIALTERGLILVTGATGEGKSSTLAAMINHINENRSGHIITIEDPIEFVHTPKKSRITQREVGVDTPDFKNALRASLRQDPDIILIGELRDAETIDTALKAAETGHVVFATVHTTDALATIGRILSMFQGDDIKSVRERIVNNLYATISQRLLKRKDGTGRVVAQEIMIMNPGIRDCILGEGALTDIYKFIEKGSKGGSGCQSFDQHILELYKKEIIDEETAKEASSSAKDFVRSLTFEDIE